MVGMVGLIFTLVAGARVGWGVRGRDGGPRGGHAVRSPPQRPPPNGDEPLRLERPDDGYADALFDGAGYLYKADSSSRFEYVGEDRSGCADQFTQINAVDDGTLQPVIDLLKWVDSADDEQFAAELDQWVDVESFAAYAATQNQLANSDDMSGPGQNYYFWYDLETKKFTVVSWDLNLSMSGDTTAGPNDSISMGGGAGPGGTPGGPGGEAPAGAMPRGAEGVPSVGGNVLKERFSESEAFAELYERTYWDQYDQIYGSGQALAALEQAVVSFPLSDGLIRPRRTRRPRHCEAG